MADKDAVADDSLDLKKRARRRLVGATALALLAIIVLPMVMDREPRSASQDIQIRIPSQEGDSLSARLPAKLPEASEPTASVLGVVPAVVAPSAPAVKTEAEKPAAQAADVGRPANKVDALKPADAVVADKPKPVEKAVPQKADEARALAALEGKSVGQWIVQLGAYQNAGNAKLLLAKIKEMNIPAYSEKLDTPQGPRVRVRAGPFSTREAAEKAQSRIRKIGVEGPVAQK